MRVKEYMTPNPITVQPDSSVLNARRLMARYGIGYLPVVTTTERLVGAVSATDVLLNEHRIFPPVSGMDWDLLIGRYQAVETVMHSPVTVTRADEDLTAAAHIMLSEHVECLPVVRAGAVVGVLTVADCVRALLDCKAQQVSIVSEVEVDPDWYKPVRFESFA